ncbi:MAG: hypothetical protein GY749_31175 [Desulfobacteraceae bacterium]|nr:hypothetical protein [Desulfobacteraceae bacterium]
MFKKAIENSTSAYPFDKYAEFLKQQNRVDEAKAICKKGLEVFPKSKRLLESLHELEEEKEEMQTDSQVQYSEISEKSSHEVDKCNEGHSAIDILIITALKDALDELLSCQGKPD